MSRQQIQNNQNNKSNQHKQFDEVDYQEQEVQQIDENKDIFVEQIEIDTQQQASQYQKKKILQNPSMFGQSQQPYALQYLNSIGYKNLDNKNPNQFQNRNNNEFNQNNQQDFFGGYGNKNNNYQQNLPANLVAGIPIYQEQIAYNNPVQQYEQQQQQDLVFNPQELNKIQLELKIKRNSRWFTGCNACWTIFLIIQICSKAAMFSKQNEQTEYSSNYREQGGQEQDINRRAAIVFVTEYVVWFLAIFFGIRGSTALQLKLIYVYMIGLVLTMILEFVANVIIMSGFSGWDNQSKIWTIVLFILTIMVQYSFIHNAKIMKNDIVQYFDHFPQQNSNEQQQELQQPYPQ